MRERLLCSRKGKRMSRYVKDMPLNKDPKFVSFMMNDYLAKNRFTPFDYKGEQVYRAGDAMLEGFKYLKWSFEDGNFHIEAWMKSMGKEMGLDGFVGCLQKKPYKESLEQLYTLLEQDVEIPEGAEGADGSVTVAVNTVDNAGAGKIALVFGILSIVTALLIPLAGILFGCLGMNRARLGSGSSMAKQANIGKVLSIIGVVIALINWLLAILL